MKKQKSSKKIVHKTNAMRILDKFKLQYECISYSDISAVSGRSVADALLENPNQVFKTLVAQGHSKKYVYDHDIFVRYYEKKKGIQRNITCL